LLYACIDMPPGAQTERRGNAGAGEELTWRSGPHRPQATDNLLQNTMCKTPRRNTEKVAKNCRRALLQGDIGLVLRPR